MSTLINTLTIENNYITDNYITDNCITIDNCYISTPSYRYEVMGKEFKYSWYKSELIIVLSLIDTLGYSYYDNILKQDLYIPTEIIEYLEVMKKETIRKEKISKII
jgi:hypothetical protein